MNAIRADIVPGVTTVDELGDLFRTGYRKDGSGLRHGDTIEAGDLICFQAGLQSFNEDPYWPCTSLCYCGYCLLPARVLSGAGWLAVGCRCCCCCCCCCCCTGFRRSQLAHSLLALSCVTLLRLRPPSVGNVCDVTFEYAYVLEQGQTALPPHLEAAWAEGLKVRKILDANILPGRSVRKTPF